MRSHDQDLRGPAVTGVEARSDGVVIRLAGELDLYNADEVRSALADAVQQKPQRLMLDLTDVAFIDSTTLGAMIDARRKLENKDGFVLCAPAIDVRRALEISGLDRHFTVLDSCD